MAVLDVRLGDVVRLRKVHPCGGDQWRVERLGADIGLRCLQCRRRVLLERWVFERRLKAFLARGHLTAEQVGPGWVDLE